MANKINSSNREINEEMNTRESSGVLKADIDALRHKPEKSQIQENSLGETVRPTYPVMIEFSEHTHVPELSNTKYVSDEVGISSPPHDNIVRRPTKLNADDVRSIVQKIIDGVRFCDIAREFGVSRTTIYDIRHGRSWKFVVGDRFSILPPCNSHGVMRKISRDEYIDDIAKDIIKGYPISEIAKKYRVAEYTVREWINGDRRSADFKDYDFSNYMPDHSLVVSNDEIIPDHYRNKNAGNKKEINYRYTNTEILMSNPKCRNANHEHISAHVDITDDVIAQDITNNAEGTSPENSINEKSINSIDSEPASSYSPLISIKRTRDNVDISLNVKLDCTITFNNNTIDIKWN